MTIREKRNALIKHCGKTNCNECKLTGKSTCKCGCGYRFGATEKDDAHISDAEVIGAYQIVFGEEASDCMAHKDDFIVIKSPSGRAVDNVIINFKEEN